MIQDHCWGTIITMSWNDDPEADRILAQTAALLAQRGDEQAVSLLIDRALSSTSAACGGISFSDSERIAARNSRCSSAS